MEQEEQGSVKSFQFAMYQDVQRTKAARGGTEAEAGQDKVATNAEKGPERYATGTQRVVTMSTWCYETRRHPCHPATRRPFVLSFSFSSYLLPSGKSSGLHHLLLLLLCVIIYSWYALHSTHLGHTLCLDVQRGDPLAVIGCPAPCPEPRTVSSSYV